MKATPASSRRNCARGGSLAGAVVSSALLLPAALGCSAAASAGTQAAASEREPDAPGVPAPGAIDADTRMGLAVLRARAVEADLARYARVLGPEQPCTFGDTVGVRFEILNALGSPLEFPAPPEGLRIELLWEVERWLPFGAREKQSNYRVARISGDIRLAPGGSYEEEVQLPLTADDDPSALWVLRLGARLRVNGVILAEQRLPVNEVAFQPARILAFPQGWESLRSDPLGSLERALPLGSRLADRHVLICAALLPPERQETGMGVLMQALADPVDAERALTITAALSWLSGEDLGPSVGAWNQWWAERNMGRDEEQP